MVEMFMLDFLPRKASLDTGEIRALPDVLRSWIRYALIRRGLDERHIEETTAMVGKLESEFRREVTNPDNFGLAKAMTNAMLADGVDLLDKDGVQAWMDAFNARPFEERDEFLSGRSPLDQLDPRIAIPAFQERQQRPPGGMPARWYVIRIELVSGGGADLDPPPGRDLLVSPQHTFRQLAELINACFARWDLGHLYVFRMADGTEIGPSVDEELDFRDAARTKVAKREKGEVFEFEFDFGDAWRHRCTVLEVGIEPEGYYGEKPKGPVAVWGWGSIPDQYGRVSPEG